MKQMAIATVLAVALATPVAAGNSISGADLRDLFPGVFKVVFEGSEAQITAHSDGGLEGRSLTESDTGRWDVRGARLCITLESWFEGKTRCSRVTRNGDWFEAQGVRFKKL